MTAIERFVHSLLVPVACLAACCGTGCTSVISSAYLRDAFWETTEHAAEAEAAAAADPSVEEATLAAADEDRRKAAIEEAVSRLSRLGDLDEATRGTLLETLERTSQEDWPAVVDAFAESLGETGGIETAAIEPEQSTTQAASPPEPHVVAKADLDAAVSQPIDRSESAPATATDAAGEPPVAAPEPPEAVATGDADVTGQSIVAAASGTDAGARTAEPDAADGDAAFELPAGEVPGTDPAPPAAEAKVSPAADAARLTIRNACFATRVQAWGVVDRFAADRFRPGQDVIVYFELDGLSAGESPAGHTTCIDTTLRLAAADGMELHAWRFEPIAETCRARRRDYFARYVVQIPESAAAGECRLGIAVTDTLSGGVAEASIPLTISARIDD